MTRVFNGTSDHIDLANESVFDQEWSSPQSGSLWVFMTATSFGAVVGKADGTVPIGWAFNTEPSGGNVPEFHMLNAAEAIGVFGPDNAIPLNNWTHLGWTYSGSGTIAGVKLYVNGAEVVTGGGSNANFGVITTGTILHNEPLRVAFINPTEFWGGRVADFAYWASVLSGANMTSIAAGGDVLSIDSANLKCYLQLCGFYSPEPDIKGGNNGTVTGTTALPHPPTIARCGYGVTAWTVA